jgi:hypothetical protein
MVGHSETDPLPVFDEVVCIFQADHFQLALVVASEIGPGFIPDIQAANTPGLQPPGHALFTAVPRRRELRSR